MSAAEKRMLRMGVLYDEFWDEAERKSMSIEDAGAYARRKVYEEFCIEARAWAGVFPTAADYSDPQKIEAIQHQNSFGLTPIEMYSGTIDRTEFDEQLSDSMEILAAINTLPSFNPEAKKVMERSWYGEEMEE